MIIDEKTENNTQSQGDDIMDTPGISQKNVLYHPLGVHRKTFIGVLCYRL